MENTKVDSKISYGDASFDRTLHNQFVKFGNDRRKLTNELLSLLPEIYKRKIYKKYAATIIEYAGKFGGLSKGVVLKRLRLEKYLKDKPKLKEAIKTEGLNKVALVASLATAENEAAWLDKVSNMSKAALQELSKEVRRNEEGRGMKDNKGLKESLFENLDSDLNTTPCKAVPTKITIELDEEMTFLFLKLKQKIGKNLSNRDVMRKVLEIASETSLQNTSRKPVKTTELIAPTSVKVIPGDNFQPAKRYVSATLKKSSLQETSGRCSYPGCNRPPENFHHTDRFAESHSHQSIRPLCKIHHEFAHNGIILNEKQSTANWQFELTEKLDNQIDYLYRKYRKNKTLLN